MASPTANPTRMSSILIMVHLALEVRRVVGAALPLVLGKLRERAQRARHLNPVRRVVAYELGRDDALWRLALLDPIHQRGQRVEHVGPGSAAAVEDAGGEEEPEEALRRLQPALVFAARLGGHHALEVVDGAARGDGRVVPAVPLDELAAVRLETGEIRVGRIDGPGGGVVCK